MHLKSLTLKGFKSFAQPTTFQFEPGVTCVVGPNGSGKSNVVDALAWVMGEQGAKTLRGGTMSDVIFAGTATRGPLGRAEVLLTIDNSERMLPSELRGGYESSTLFPNGGTIRPNQRQRLPPANARAAERQRARRREITSRRSRVAARSADTPARRVAADHEEVRVA